MTKPMTNLEALIEHHARGLTFYCHAQARKSGWWNDLQTGQDLRWQYPAESPGRNIGETLMLIVSEIAEAMEGARKGLQDDKLPHRSMLEVELADALIRIFDLAGGAGLDVGGAMAEKLSYNATRADHDPEARRADGGKRF